MATFTYSPDWAPTPELTPRMKSVRFGDGYEQRAPDGLNPILPTWKLNFSVRSQTEAFAIYTWLLDNQAWVTPFDWAAPGQGTATAEPFATGTGTRATFHLVASGRRVNHTGTPTIYRTDWQGTYQLFSTARTNQLLWSEDLSNAAWVKSLSTINANAATAPDGTFTADKLIATAGTSTTGADGNGGVNQAITVLASNLWTRRFWAKSGEVGFVRVCEAATTGARAKVNLTDGSVVYEVGTSASLAVTTALDPNMPGWWIITCTRTTGGAETSSSLSIKPGIDTGDGTSGIYVWGLDLRQGAFTGGYIRTEGAAVTVTDYTITSAGLVTLASTTNPVASQNLGTASGSTPTFPVVTPNGSTPTVLNVWRTDWQGRQRMYPTARTNKAWRSQPTIAQLAAKSATVTDTTAPAPFPGGAAIKFPAALQNDYAYAACDNTILNPVASVFIVMNDAGAPVPGTASTNGDFLLVVNAGANFAASNMTTTSLGGGLYRVSAKWVGTTTNTSFGLFRYATQSGRGFTVMGFQIEADNGTGLPTSLINCTGAATTVTDWSQSASNVVFASNPLAGAVIEADYSYIGPPPSGTTFTWTGTYTRKYVADTFTEPRPDTYGSWSLGATFREVVG